MDKTQTWPNHPHTWVNLFTRTHQTQQTTLQSKPQNNSICKYYVSNVMFSNVYVFKLNAYLKYKHCYTYVSSWICKHIYMWIQHAYLYCLFQTSVMKLYMYMFHHPFVSIVVNKKIETKEKTDPFTYSLPWANVIQLFFLSQ